MFLFLNKDLNQRCEEIQNQLDAILTKEKPSIWINEIQIRFDEFDILLISEDSAFLKLKKNGEKIAFVNIDSIKEFEE